MHNRNNNDKHNKQMSKIRISLLTFTHDYEATGNMGTIKYFKLRDQVMGDGPIKVLVKKEEERLVIKMYKIVEKEEFWLIPYDIVVEDDKIIPEGEKNMRDWYKSKYYSDWTGDIRGLVLELEGIDIHGRLEHNGEAVWAEIQKTYPTRRIPKFNASTTIELKECVYNNEEVYYVK